MNKTRECDVVIKPKIITQSVNLMAGWAYVQTIITVLI
jgi:hypothetical protein